MSGGQQAAGWALGLFQGPRQRAGWAHSLGRPQADVVLTMSPAKPDPEQGKREGVNIGPCLPAKIVTVSVMRVGLQGSGKGR